MTTVRTLLGELCESSHRNSHPTVSSVQLASTSGKAAEPKRRGRPKGSKNKAIGFNPEKSAAKRRSLSPAAKERIAAAQRARCAKQKGSAVAQKNNSSSAKKEAVKAAGKTASASGKKGTARNLLTPAVKKPAPARKAATRVIPAKRPDAKVLLKQIKKNVLTAAGKRAAGKKFLAKGLVSDPPLPGSGAPAEVKASSQL